MRILVDIGHPGHVHFYKNVIWRLQKEGHDVIITARDKDVTISLLEHYGFSYHIFSDIGKNYLGLAKEFMVREFLLSKFINKLKPDVITEIGGMFISFIGKILGIPSVVFTDSEPVPLDKYLVYPFADVIATPDCFLKEVGKNHIRYAGFHEMAYLSPNYFTPDSSVLDELGVDEDEQFIILRFVAWKAGHDIGQHGFSLEMKNMIIKELSSFAKVFISSESPLSDALEGYRINLPPHRMHDAMYYAKMFMGDGATMATEAGLLGTPSVRSSSMAFNMGNFIELMERYQIVYSYYNPLDALQKAVTLLRDKKSKEKWWYKREKIFSDKIDVNKLIVSLIKKEGIYSGNIRN